MATSVGFITCEYGREIKDLHLSLLTELEKLLVRIPLGTHFIVGPDPIHRKLSELFCRLGFSVETNPQFGSPINSGEAVQSFLASLGTYRKHSSLVFIASVEISTFILRQYKIEQALTPGIFLIQGIPEVISDFSNIPLESEEIPDNSFRVLDQYMETLKLHMRMCQPLPLNREINSLNKSIEEIFGKLGSIDVGGGEIQDMEGQIENILREAVDIREILESCVYVKNPEEAVGGDEDELEYPAFIESIKHSKNNDYEVVIVNSSNKKLENLQIWCSEKLVLGFCKEVLPISKKKEIVCIPAPIFLKKGVLHPCLFHGEEQVSEEYEFPMFKIFDFVKTDTEIEFKIKSHISYYLNCTIEYLVEDDEDHIEDIQIKGHSDLKKTVLLTDIPGANKLKVTYSEKDSSNLILFE